MKTKLLLVVALATLSVNAFSLNAPKLHSTPTTSSRLKQATIYPFLGHVIVQTQSKTIRVTDLKSGDAYY